MVGNCVFQPFVYNAYDVFVRHSRYMALAYEILTCDILSRPNIPRPSGRGAAYLEKRSITREGREQSGHAGRIPSSIVFVTI